LAQLPQLRLAAYTCTICLQNVIALNHQGQRQALWHPWEGLPGTTVPWVVPWLPCAWAAGLCVLRMLRHREPGARETANANLWWKMLCSWAALPALYQILIQNKGN